MERIDDDEADCGLSPSTLLALNEFRQEQERMKKDGHLLEDWQLSQFWYTDETSRQIVDECICSLNGTGRIACLCCPSLVQHFMDTKEFKMKTVEMCLFEYDRRFEQKFPQLFCYYDYQKPLDVPEDLHHKFDFLIVDPPFISDECLVKVAQTIRLLSTKESKLMVNTGAVMEQLIHRILDVRRTEFRPTHKTKVANEFLLFSNYPFTIL